MNPLALIDQYVGPIVVAANRIRQARDSMPTWAWQFVPSPIRAPIDGLFEAVAAYDRRIGQLKDTGLI